MFKYLLNLNYQSFTSNIHHHKYHILSQRFDSKFTTLSSIIFRSFLQNYTPNHYIKPIADSKKFS